MYPSKLTFVVFLHTFLVCCAAHGALGLFFGYRPSVLRSFFILFLQILVSVSLFLGAFGSAWPARAYRPPFWPFSPCLEVRGLLVQQVLFSPLLFLCGRRCIFIWTVRKSFLSFSHGCYRGRNMRTQWRLIWRNVWMVSLKFMAIPLTCRQSLLPTCSPRLGRTMLSCNPWRRS